MKSTHKAPLMLSIVALAPGAHAAVPDLIDLQRSLTAFASWTTDIADTHGGFATDSIGPTFTIGTFDDTAVAAADDQYGGITSDVSTATASQTSFISNTHIHGDMFASVTTVGDASAEAAQYQATAYLFVEFSLTEPCTVRANLSVDQPSGSALSQTQAYVYLHDAVGNPLSFADSRTGILSADDELALPAGTYFFSVIVGEADGIYDGFPDDHSNSATFDLEFIPAPGTASLLALAALGAFRRRRRSTQCDHAP